MWELQRRSFLQAMATIPFMNFLPSDEPKDNQVRIVPAGADRTGTPHKAARAGSHLDFKVITSDTAGRVFIMENRDMKRGGPPRHIHFEQEEWFYFVEGNAEVVMEVGDQKLRLKPGDSMLAPRSVPHVWAYLGDQPGRMLFAFSPAAKIEDFFIEASKPDARVDDASRFERHGMKLVGPPLSI